MDNSISMQHHDFVRIGCDSMELADVGPRTTMSLLELWAGRLDNKGGDVQCHLTQYRKDWEE